MAAEKNERDMFIIEMTSRIVSAYLSNNAVPAGNLPSIIKDVKSTMDDLPSFSVASGEGRRPAVPIEESIQDDYLVCLEDGKRFKSLKRHLRTSYHLTPDEYRERWNLPSDYPMVAPAYSKTRSVLAKKMGAGSAQSRSLIPHRPDEIQALQ